MTQIAYVCLSKRSLLINLKECQIVIVILHSQVKYKWLAMDYYS